MRIINFLKKKEYQVGLIIIIFNLVIIIFYGDLITKQILLIHITSIFIIIFHNLLCIFMESEFKSNKLRLLQLQIEDKLSFISLIVVFSIVVANFFVSGLCICNSIYKSFCPFFLKNFDYDLHLKRRCELYNTIVDKKILQYICSYDASKMSSISIKIFQLLKIIEYPNFGCYKVKSLINNDVINNFVNEYYNEDIYYCDFKNTQLWKVKSSDNPKICQSSVVYLDIFIIPYIILGIYYISYNYNYFKNIRANINFKQHLL